MEWYYKGTLEPATSLIWLCPIGYGKFECRIYGSNGWQPLTTEGASADYREVRALLDNKVDIEPDKYMISAELLDKLVGLKTEAELDEATHAAKADYATSAGYADKAGSADNATVAQNLSTDSTDWPKIDGKDAAILNSAIQYVLDNALSKINPDTAQKLITFLGGIKLGSNFGIDATGNAILKQAVLDVLKSPDFSSGLVDGSGFELSKDANGKTSLEIDKLLVRLKMIISELEIRKLSYVGGDEVYSSAGSHIVKVVNLPDSGDYRCYMLADDGTTSTMNNWRVGDQAKCSTNNIQEGIYENVSNRYYWRLVVARGTETLEDNKLYHYVDLSNTNANTHGSLSIIGEDGNTHSCVGYDTTIENDAPQAEDDIVQLGNQIDETRRYAYIIYVSEHKRVDYAGISDFDLASHEVELHSATGGFVNSDRFEIRSSSGTGVSSPIVCERGQWYIGMICGHYDHVSHNNATWLCNVGKGMTTTEEPKDGSTVWIKETYGTGTDAIIYSITPSVYCITKSVTNTFTPSSVTFDFYKTIGSTKTACSGYYKTYRSIDGTSYTPIASLSGYSASITPSSTDKSVKCVLYSDSAYTNMVDYQTVVIVSEGINGKDAINGVLTNDSVTLPASSSGVVSDFSTATGTFKVWNGSTDVTGTSVTYGSSASGCTGTITTAGVYSVTAMSANIGTLTLTATYGGVTITRIFSVSRAPCRERVSNSVKVSLAAESLKHKADR